MWRDVLLSDAEFHRPDRSDHTEEDTYTFELAYQRLLVQDDDRVRSKANTLIEQANYLVKLLQIPVTKVPMFDDFAHHLSSALSSVISSSEMLEDAKWSIAEHDPEFSPFVGAMNVDDRRKGQPWVRDFIKESVRVQQGVQRKRTAPQQPEDMEAPPMPGRPMPPGKRP
jgi:hypothetical protein